MLALTLAGQTGIIFMQIATNITKFYLSYASQSRWETEFEVEILLTNCQ
jgi:hypothetical protein